MKIYDFGILDNQINNLNEYKSNLLNKIIYYILPFIKKDINLKIIEIKKKEKELKKIRSDILELKTNLIELDKNLAKKKKLNILLNRMFNLLSIGNFIELKPKFIAIINNIDVLSDQEIDIYLSEMIEFISKKFSQSNSFF